MPYTHQTIQPHNKPNLLSLSLNPIFCTKTAKNEQKHLYSRFCSSRKDPAKKTQPHGKSKNKQE